MSFQVINYLNMKRYRSGHNGADSKSQNFGRADDINCIRRGIEVVITGLTRNFLKSWLFAPLKKPVKSGVFSGSKIKYFVVLSVSSFQKFLEEMRNHIHGELSEWSKVQHSKCCVQKCT